MHLNDIVDNCSGFIIFKCIATTKASSVLKASAKNL